MNMTEMLKKLGWGDGFHIPIANEENRALEEKLMQLTIRRAKASTEYDTAKSRCEAFDKHLKFLNDECDQNHILISEYKKQIETAQNRHSVNCRQREKMLQEMRQMRQRIAELHDRQEQKRADLARGMARMEKLKAESSWDAEALAAWEEALDKREEDNDLLRKFSAEDARRVNELEAKRKALAQEVVNKRATVDHTVSDVINYEQIHDRYGKVLQRQSRDRVALIEQWQNSIRNMRQRDSYINETNEQISGALDGLHKQREQLDESNQFLNNERSNNAAIERETAELNQQNSRMRLELNAVTENAALTRNNASNIRSLLTASAHRLEKERMMGKKLEQNVRELEVKIDEDKCLMEELRKKREEVMDSSMTAAERYRRLEQIVDAAKKKEATLGVEIERMEFVHGKSMRVMRQLADEHKTLVGECESLHTVIKNQHKQAVKEKTTLEQHQGIVYDNKLRLDQILQKLRILEGQVNDVETADMWMKRIEELECLYAKQIEKRNYLQSQVTKLADEMRTIQSEITAETKNFQNLQGKLADNRLLYEGGLKMAEVALHRHHKRQADENVLRLRVSQIEKAIENTDTKIYNVKRMTVDLETAMHERRIEVEATLDVLQARKRHQNEENMRLRTEISERQHKLKQMQSRHYLALLSLGKDEDGEPFSMTHYKVRNAQEKFELRQCGDDLDIKIAKAEKEIEAMENTLKVVNATNAKFRTSLTEIELDGSEAQEMNELKEEFISVTQKLRLLKHTIKTKQNRIIDLQNALVDLVDKRESNKNRHNEIELLNAKYNKENVDNLDKIKRTSHRINKLKKEIPATKLTKYDKNLHNRQLHESNKNALHELRVLSENSIETTPLVNQYLAQHELTLPGAKQVLRSESSMSSESKMSLNTSSLGSASTSSSQSTSRVVTTPNQVTLTFDGPSSLPSSATSSRNTKPPSKGPKKPSSK